MKGQRGVFALLGLAAILFASAATLRWRADHPPVLRRLVGQPRAQLDGLRDADQKPFSTVVRGRVVVLNLWAPWCAPCVKEMPALDRLAADPAFADFAILAAAVDRDDKARGVFARLGLNRLQFLVDPQGLVARSLGARGFPTTIILDPDGAPLAFREGEADWDSAALRAELAALRSAPQE